MWTSRMEGSLHLKSHSQVQPQGWVLLVSTSRHSLVMPWQRHHPS